MIKTLTDKRKSIKGLRVECLDQSHLMLMKEKKWHVQEKYFTR